MIITGIIAFIIALFGAFVMQVVVQGFWSLEQTQSQKQLKDSGYFYFYRALLQSIFKKQEQEVLLFSLVCARHAVRYIAGVCLSVLLYILWIDYMKGPFSDLYLILSLLIAFPFTFIIFDYLPRLFALRSPEMALRFFSPFATLYLLIAFPATAIFFFVSGRKLASIYAHEVHYPVIHMKEKIVEMIQQAPKGTSAEEEEKALLESVAELPERIVREVMIPRVEIFAIDETLSIREAAQLLNEEGYSRAPVYKESIDQVKGLLMYKDLMNVLLECSEVGNYSALDRPVETLAKPILYVPETSSVIHLLREFRQKQTHLAVVVDEYGGTEGIATIEDCLEEIVGEIADEYDEEDELFIKKEGAGWIIDARMSIYDIEDKLGIEIPQEGEYDTIGGYAFHRAGEIPQKGLKIHHDDFELEVLESSERCVEKVLIIPNKKIDENR